MRVDIVTIFPDMVRGFAREGIVARAHERGVVDLAVHDLRDFTTDRHRVVDDTPFGGGPGMVLKPEPFFRAMAHIRATRGEPSAVIVPSPQGRRFTHDAAVAWSRAGHIVLLCGRYEGIDERVVEAPGDRRGVDRRLRAVGRRARGDGGGRRGGAAGAGGRGRCPIGQRGFLRAAVARPPPLHPPRRVGRTAGAGRAALGASRARWRAGGCGRRSSGRSIAGRICSRGPAFRGKTAPTPSGR